MTEEQAFAEMRKRAQDMLDGGCDQPEVSLKVDFVSLGDSEEYAQFREMDKLFMYDEVTVVSERGYADANAQVVSMSWDCLHDRMLELGVGSIGATLTSGKLASWQIPSGISGGKITYGSVGSAQLGQDVVSARHMQAESVSAEAIQTKALTAEKVTAAIINATTAYISKIVTDKITTDELYANIAKIAIAQITTANIDKANINWASIATLNAGIITALTAYINALDADKITTDELYASIAKITEAWIKTATIHSAQIEDLSATVAKIVSADIKTADIDYAQIKDLLAQKAIITDGVGGSLLIERLAVTSANMLGATIGELVLKGDDGRYYAVIVSADGTIHTQEVTVSAGEIAAGQTATGKEIVETNMNVGALNAQDIKAQQAIISEIFTAALTAGKITAGEAMIASAVIPELYVTTIRAIGESLELVNGRTNIIHRGETPPVNAGAGDLWVQPSTGALFQAASGGAGLPEFAIDEAGVLYYSYGEGQTVYALTLDENGDLYVDEAAPFAIAIGPEGQIIPWERVKDGELQAGIDENKEAIDGANKLIREQSAKITEMADAIDLRVTTEVYEEGLKGLGELIQKNEASITLLDKSITSKVSQEVYDEDTGAIREEVSQIKQTADNIRLEVKKKTAVFRQEAMPDSYVKGDLWIKPSDGTMKIADDVGGALVWRALKPSELSTSCIDIAQDHIDIYTGGNLNVNSGAVHFNTSKYTLAILTEENSEETVMDFDAESKALRVTEIVADNVRPYIAGTTRVTSSQIGGLDGLAGLLAKNQYEHIIYTQEADDYSSALIEIRGSNSIVVEIIANTLTRVPSLRFYGITGNVLLRNLKWEMSSKDSAFMADSGVITMLNCYINAQYGIFAEYGARINWIGNDGTMTYAGKCTSAMATVNNCADIKLFGLIPSGPHLTYNGGTITPISTKTGETVDDIKEGKLWQRTTLQWATHSVRIPTTAATMASASVTAAGSGSYCCWPCSAAAGVSAAAGAAALAATAAPVCRAWQPALISMRASRSMASLRASPQSSRASATAPTR